MYLSSSEQLNRFTNGRRFASSDFACFSQASATVRAALGVKRLSSSQAAEVHAAVARHQARKLHREGRPSSRPNRILKRQTAKREAFATKLGEAFNRRVRNLYTSQRAQVVYGVGGQSDVDYDAYAKSYGYPARWKNAGARIESGAHGWVVVLETSRGTEAARISVDFSKSKSLLLRHEALIEGDLWGVERHGIIERYRYVRGKVVEVGFAVRFSNPVYGTQYRHPLLPDSSLEFYWEHGSTIAKCREEFSHKNEILNTFLRAQDLSSKVQRAARLIGRLVNDLLVTYADARAVGHCNAGILGWCERYGINPDAPISMRRLRELAVKDARAQQVLNHVALRCAQDCFGTLS